MLLHVKGNFARESIFWLLRRKKPYVIVKPLTTKEKTASDFPKLLFTGENMKQFDGNIFLIGFMGSGKSTISRFLQNAYDRNVLEMDEEIEAREQMKISDIFATQGEEYFRKLETELLLELEGKTNLVVSCGGGAPLRACNVEAMKKSGKVVFLTATPETVLERVKNNHDRPLLENNKNVDFIASMMEQRREKYEAAADIQVPTDGRSAKEIGAEIMLRLMEETRI